MDTREVVGLSNVITVVPTLDTSAYAAGDRLGTIHSISDAFRATSRSFSGARSILQSIVIVDLASQNANFDILFFDQLPTVASADNTALNIADAEMAKCIGAVSCAESYITTTANSVMTVRNIGLMLQRFDNLVNNLWAVVKIQSTATYAASSLTFKYSFLQD